MSHPTREQKTYDLLVVGGGINGAGIARDAAGRGLSVLLVEKDDLAAHTSQWSSKLIHGGLRYLEQYEFRLVGEALAEREVLLKVAPHLIKPLQFVLPHEPHLRPKLMLRAGLFLYDRLGGWSGQKQSLPKSFATSLAQSPDQHWGAGLKSQFVDGFVYSDAQVNDARLVVENAKDARARGADIRVGTQLVRAARIGDYWQATIRGTQSQGAHDPFENINARAIVNAAGPWVKSLLDNIDTPETKETVKHIKGSHIIVPRVHDRKHAYILQNRDGRIVFVIPYFERFSLIGTTDVPVTDFATPQISEEETDYLLALANSYLAKSLTRKDIVSSYAGVRPLYDDGDSNPSEITRDYTLKLDTHNKGAPLLNIYGGKITTYRKLAQHAIEKLLPFFPHATPSSWTHQPLQSGATAAALRALKGELRGRGLTQGYAHRLVNRYGMAADALANKDMGEVFDETFSEAEIGHLRDNEWANSAQSMLQRRTKTNLLATPQSLARIHVAISAALR
ncbi:MAG: glycerol-3-phosphate dehydrogenase [Betaproteobacteria bacterium]|nr:MAG: glycerol-3-phosphate dehydrogenase [Betaproteobacteria bacterium]